MLKNIRKYLEYLFFILVNIFLWIPVYGEILTHSDNIAEYLAIHLYNSSPINLEQLNDPMGIILLCTVFLNFIIIKPFIFHFLYILKNLFPNIHNFFDKLRTDNKFLLTIFGISFILDSISLIFFKNIWSFFGLSFNYAIFLLFFLPVNKNNIDKYGKIIKSQNFLSKIITILVLSIIIILVIIINIIPFYLFLYKIFMKFF